jgi:hypothetical protein
MADAAWYAREAEKFADTAARHMTEDPRDMRISEVAAGIAQAYATLALTASQRPDVVAAYVHDDHDTAFESSCAACVSESVDSAAARLDAMRRVVGAHLCEGLAHSDRAVRDFLRGLADELECAGVAVDDVVEETAQRVGYGPHRFSVGGRVYSLDHQWIDALGVVWEHAGDWDALHEPVMCTPDVSPAFPRKSLPELIRIRGPLRSVKAAPLRNYDEGWGHGSTFDRETGIYQPYGVPARRLDLNRPIEDKNGTVWRWTGEFDRDEPWLRCEPRDGSFGHNAILSAVEVFDGPLRQAESADSAAAVSS